jgi:hypothetical protein
MKKKIIILSLVLFCSATVALASELPTIAVYVTGSDISGKTKDALGAFLLDGLANSGQYRAIERSESFLAAIEQEHATQRSGAVDNDQIRELGKQAGVQFVCIASITPAMGQHQISARIIDIETAAITASGVSGGSLRTLDDLKRVAAAVIYNMIGVRVNIDKDFELLTEREETVLEQKVERSVEEGIRRSKQKKPSFWIGTGVGAVGLGVLAYGISEEINVSNNEKNYRMPEAKEAEKRRNAAYAVGAAVLLSGISIIIFF